MRYVFRRIKTATTFARLSDKYQRGRWHASRMRAECLPSDSEDRPWSHRTTVPRHDRPSNELSRDGKWPAGKPARPDRLYSVRRVKMMRDRQRAARMTFLHRSGVAKMMRSNRVESRRVASRRVGRRQVVVARRSIGGDICRRGGEVHCNR